MKMNINFDQYKRLFAFGCSFTQYGWPTWSDLIALNYKDKEYFNYGHPGLGNIGIAAKISEVNKRYEFCETDLVMVMWSTFCREDRWVESGWLSFGNVWNSEYGLDWVKKYADPTGYLIRDHAIINLTNNWLQNSKFGTLILKAAPLIYTELPKLENRFTQEIQMLYGKEYNDLPMDLYNFMGQDWGKCQQEFLDDSVEKPFVRHDCHPFTSLYAEYLQTIGLNLSKSTLSQAYEADEILQSCKTKSEIVKKFEYLKILQSKNKKAIF